MKIQERLDMWVLSLFLDGNNPILITAKTTAVIKDERRENILSDSSRNQRREKEQPRESDRMGIVRADKEKSRRSCQFDASENQYSNMRK